MQRVTIIGAGSWGTALAVHLGRVGHDVRLWARDAKLAAALTATRVNQTYLPDVRLPATVDPTASLEEALSQTQIVVAAVPSQGMRSTLRLAAPWIPKDVPMVSAAKGLEAGTLARMSDVIEEEVAGANPVVVLSGPSFALEVARECPTAVLAGSTTRRAAETIQEQFRGRAFRLYVSDDVAGIEMGGALKNVIAIAAGVVESLGLGHNALAALMTRGLAEISRLALAVGGRRDTLAGLSGLGDLVLTCTSTLSRNHYVGAELGKGKPLSEVLAGMRMVAEGVQTTAAALTLGEKHGVELPIAAQMAEVMAGRATPRSAAEVLMLRPQRAEPEPDAPRELSERGSGVSSD